MKVELAHDSLAAKIYDKVSLDEKNLRKVEKFIGDRYAFYQTRKSQNKALLTKDDLDYIHPYMNEVDIEEEERRFVDKSEAVLAQKQRFQMISIAIIFLLLSGMAAYSYYMKGEAEDSALLAKRQSIEADSLAKLAKQEAENARQAEGLAENRRKIADSSAVEAERARAEAERRRIQADSTAAIAERERQEAEKQRKKAVDAQALAETAQKQEHEAREKAEDASFIAQMKEREAKEHLMQSIAQSMAARSLQLDDPQLKARIAYQAFKFNQSNQGDPYDRIIYEALYYASRDLKGMHAYRLKGHNSAVRSMVFDQKGQQFFTTGSDGKILQWDWTKDLLEGRQGPLVIQNSQSIKRALTINNSGTKMVVGADRAPYLQLFDMTTIPPSRVSTPQFEFLTQVIDIVFMPEGNSILVLGEDAVIYHYDFLNQRETVIASCQMPMRSIAVRPDGQEVAGISKSGKLLLWDISDKPDTSVTQILSDSLDLISICYNKSHGKHHLAAGDKNGIVWVWDWEQAKILTPLRGHKARISDLAFSRNGEYLATASYDGSVQLWVVGNNNFQTRLPIVMRDHKSWVMSLAFSPDGRNLITGERDGQIKLWPTHPQDLTVEMCNYIGQNLTKDEWNLYVGDDITPEKTCEQYPLFTHSEDDNIPKP